MKNDLLCLYRQSPTWLRLPDNSGYGEMLYRVTSSLGLLLDRNDVPAVTAILESSTDRVAMSEDLLAKLAMTAAKLDPDRAEGTLLAQLQRTPKQSQLAVMAAELNPAKAEEILLAQLQRMPGESYLAVRLVKVSGLAHFDLVKKSYHTSGGESDNQSVIAAIGDLKSKAAAKALGELLAGDDLSVAENPVRQNRYGYNETRQRIFTAYVQAAEMINGKAVIDKELFNQALTQTGKFTTPQMEAHNKQTGAFRKQALNELTKFFAQQ